MERYEPMRVEEVSKIIYQIANNKDSIDKFSIDKISYTGLNKIREIDIDNFTAEVERGVTLGNLAQELDKKNLFFAPFTPDIEELTVGEFFSKQISSLTGVKYGNPKFHVMGLEVVLANGEVVKTGGKTVKNVTGYDLIRTFLSSRDTIGIPVVYTLKLLPQEETKALFLIIISNYHKLKKLLEGLAQEKVVPAVCCFWNDSRENKKQVSLLLELRGIQEKVELEKQKLVKIVYSIEETINELNDENSINDVWQKIKSLRSSNGWADSFKIPQDKITPFITEINNIQDVSLGYWGNPLQGKINILVLTGQKNKGLYEKLVLSVRQLGGASSWYQDFQYGLANDKLQRLFYQIKEKFDPLGILKPLKGEEM